MKKITQKEFDGLKLVLRGNRSGKNPVINELNKLEIGGILRFDKKDWLPKTEPGILIGATFRTGKKFTTRTLADKSGWVIKRLK